PVVVTLSANDGAGDGSGASGVRETRFAIVDKAGNAGPEQTYSSDDKPTLGDGESLRYWSVDDAGNVEDASTTAAAKVDGTAPTTTGSVPAEWRNAPVVVTLDASDAGSSGVAATRFAVVAADGTVGDDQTY